MQQYIHPTHRVCVICKRIKPIVLFHGDTKICPTCNVKPGEAALMEASKLMQNDVPATTAPVASPTKRCCTCKTVQPVANFSNNRSSRDGLQWACKTCQAATARQSAERKKMLISVAERAQKKKACYRCHKEKPLEAFWRDATKHDGRTASCKVCNRGLRRANKRRKAKMIKAITPELLSTYTRPVRDPWWKRLMFWR